MKMKLISAGVILLLILGTLVYSIISKQIKKTEKGC